RRLRRDSRDRGLRQHRRERIDSRGRARDCRRRRRRDEPQARRDHLERGRRRSRATLHGAGARGARANGGPPRDRRRRGVMRRGGITWGVGFLQTHVLADLVADVQAAEQAEFDYFWYGNEKLHSDMWVGLTAAALNSTTTRVGTFIADPYSLHPAITAAMVATLDHYSDGRAVLVFGAGGSGLRELGMGRRKPLDAIASALTIVRELLRGESVERDGPLFPAHAQLHFPARADIPIWIASRGERMLELAGQIADGVMVGTIARAADIAWAVDRIRAGATTAGRSLDELTVSARV